MSNSKLISATKISPNKTSPRNHKIDTITIHCYVAQASIESMMSWFATTGAQCSCNYGIGSDGRIALIVDEKDRAWCTSSGANDHRAVTIECASDKVYPYAVNSKVYESLIKLVADICKRNDIKKLIWKNDKSLIGQVDKQNLTVHRWFAAKECPGQYLLERHSDIANRVNALLGQAQDNTATNDEKTQEPQWYRVRSSWSNVSSQIGAYTTLENAKKECPVGYKVFDYMGKEVYSNVPDTSLSSGIPASKQDYIDKVAAAAIKLYPKTKILPSVVIAQCCLETGYGLGTDSTELVKRNNLLGMKSDLINSTWKDFTVWDGTSFSKKTPEYYNGVKVYITDQFRVYKDYENCIEDYEMFLTNVKNNSGYKYRQVVGMTDPEKVITAISKGGYATDPSYITKVMNLIKENNFTKYDKIEIKEETMTTPIKETYTVALGIMFDKFVSKIGTYDSLEKATKKCKDGYKVYNQKNKVVLDKTIHPWNNVLQMYDVVMQEEVASGIKWFYSNSGCKSTWKSAHENKTYKTNCAQSINWMLRNQNILKAGSRLWGSYGKIIWVGDAEKLIKEKCEIINFNGKTVNAAIKDGSLKPGDIVMYKDMQHTNFYLGDKKWFDSGHAYCAAGQVGEGAKFKVWIGGTIYGNNRISYVIRLKEQKKITENKTVKEEVSTSAVKKSVYKVQIGQYSIKENADIMVKNAKNKGFDSFIETKNKQYYVICGSFANKENATARVKALKKIGIEALIQ